MHVLEVTLIEFQIHLEWAFLNSFHIQSGVQL